MSSKVKYKGSVIAELNTNTSKTLKTSGTYCEADIVVENTQDGGITPSGTKEITDNGTYDVTEYASANVNVPKGITPSGQLLITQNGTFDVTNYASALVDVQGGGGDLPDWIVMGEVTPQTNLTEYTVTHNKGRKPIGAFLYAEDIYSTSTYLHKMSVGIPFNTSDGIASASTSNNYQGNTQGVTANYQGVQVMDENIVTFNTRGGNYVMKAGFTFKYFIFFTEG